MKILYLSIGIMSPVHQSLELCRRLVEAGHEVVYASHAEIGDTVRAHGHAFFPLEDPPESQPLPLGGLKNPRAFFSGLAERRRLRESSLGHHELVRLLQEIEPDRIVADLEMHAAILKIFAPARQRAIPLVLALGFFSVHKEPGLPPLHTAHPMAGSFLSRCKVELLWLRLWLETRHFEWRQRLQRLKRGDLAKPVPYACFDIDDLRAIARVHAFPLRRHTSRRQWLRPFMYTRLPVLCLNASEMDWPASRKPSNLTHVGPMVHLERRDVGCDEVSSQLWRSFLEERDEQRPLIYASLGSFWSANIELLQQIIGIFRRHPEWDLVLGLGGKLEPSALSPLPGNVLALEWAPQIAILRHAAAAIVHGGVATLGECARLRVPMVVYSTGFVEQNGNAARIAHRGLGLVAPHPQDIEDSIRRVLEEPAMRRRLEALAQNLEGYEQPDLAVHLIESAEVISD